MVNLRRRMELLEANQVKQLDHPDAVRAIFISHAGDDDPVQCWKCGDFVIHREVGEDCEAFQERAAAAAKIDGVAIFHSV